jgi:hypothetical protein
VASTLMSVVQNDPILSGYVSNVGAHLEGVCGILDVEDSDSEP